MSADGTMQVREALSGVQTESGAGLLGLTEDGPVLLVFLRHFGCSFCRKMIIDVAELGPELARRGVRPVFVHLGTVEVAKAHFDYYGIGGVERVHDPEARIYQMPVFGLGKKNPLGQALHPVVWFGWLKGTIFKHGIGKIESDGRQMPGVFLIEGGRIVRRFVHRTIADEVDWLRVLG